MRKEKRSFLDKFTGAGETIAPQEERQSMPIYNDDAEMEMPISQNTQAPPTEETTWNEESATDEEGQLTIDVYQTDNDIIIKSTIAGVKPENLDVSISNDMITIKGERIQEDEVADDDYYYQECYWGSFSRSLVLPTDVLVDKIDATLKNGILTIRLPKADTTKTKKIQVRGF